MAHEARLLSFRLGRLVLQVLDGMKQIRFDDIPPMD
jgi:hypothetical protein